MSQNNSNDKAAMLAKLSSINQVEGFDPTPFAVEYTDLNTGESRKRLPVMIQMAWFRLKYPEGRIAVQVTPSKDCFVATARIYPSYKDSSDCYLAEATASRGPDASKPVMEGKGVLFKVFADIDVFDIELNVKEPEKLIETIKTMEPTFGAINLEDIKAPECFMVEERLREEMNIPVFHDDQHGTAVISGAALLNAAELTGRKLEDMKVVVVGAGAAGISCAKFYMTLGVRREHIYMFDSKGLIHTGRIDLHATKAQFSQSEDCSLEEALTGADVFLGLSTKGLLTQDMVKLMAPSPIIFACANPDPEITYQDAKKARPDCIMGSGRSDWPNQVNNVSCFPFIFRAALDVRASVINEQMKIAAARALADLAKEPVPQEVIDLYGGAPLSFGIDYVIPKPIDPRIIEWECPAVAQAAMISGVAQSPIRDMEAYTLELRKRIAAARERVSCVVRSYL